MVSVCGRYQKDRSSQVLTDVLQDKRCLHRWWPRKSLQRGGYGGCALVS